MSNIKAQLTLILPGRVMVSEKLAKENPNQYTQHSTLNVEGKNGKKETLHIRTRKCVPCIQIRNITKECYDYITKEATSHGNHTSVAWKKMNGMERFDSLMKELAEEAGAIDYSFKIFQD